MWTAHPSAPRFGGGRLDAITRAVLKTFAYDMLRAGKQPQRPEWTSSFVVPGVNPESKNYGKVSNVGKVRQ